MADAYTPAWWVAKLDTELTERQATIGAYEAYYRGQHPLAFASPKFRSAFGTLLREFSDNFCPIIVDSVEERLNIDGFRLGAAGQEADADAWRIWQANALDLESQLAHREALVTGSGYVTVWAGDDPTTPLITVESAQQVIIGYAPGNRRQRLAAWKRWWEDDGYLYATLYLPDQILKFRSASKFTDGFISSGQTIRWVERPGDPGMPNPLGVVPVVELRNNPRILGPAESELSKVIGLQDAINKLCMDMLVASEFVAYPQRWVTGLEVANDDAGNPIEPFKPGIDRLFLSEDPETKFGSFQAADLSNYTRSIETLVQHIASQSRIPFHYFLLNGGQAPSGESIRSAEAGLVAKVRRKQRGFGESWEEVMRLSFRVLGDDARAAAFDAETIWADPETRTEAEHVDAITKQASLGVPTEVLWERLGYSPQEIARMRAMGGQDAILQALIQPAPEA